MDKIKAQIKGTDRLPVVRDEVIIYSGATMLGQVVVGRGSAIGGNVRLTRSVSSGSRIMQGQEHQQRFGNMP